MASMVDDSFVTLTPLTLTAVMTQSPFDWLRYERNRMRSTWRQRFRSVPLFASPLFCRIGPFLTSSRGVIDSPSTAPGFSRGREERPMEQCPRQRLKSIPGQQRQGAGQEAVADEDPGAGPDQLDPM